MLFFSFTAVYTQEKPILVKCFFWKQVGKGTDQSILELSSGRVTG